MKFAFEIKTEPMTQAAVIIGVIAFASGSLATIAIYVDSPLVGITCAFVLAVIIYLALCLAPCWLSLPAISPMQPPLLTGAPMGGPRDIAPPPVIPLVLQVSPLPGSSDWEEFFYNSSPDEGHGPIAAAHEFFSGQGHEVIDCPRMPGYRRLSSGAPVRHHALPSRQPPPLCLHQGLCKASGVGYCGSCHCP
jgi:hypothetical protein